MRRAYGLLLVSCLLLPSCGGGDSGSPTSPPPTGPPAPITTSIYSQPFSVSGAPAGSFVFGSEDVSVPNSGNVQVTFDWTFSNSDIDLVVTDTACPDPFSAFAGVCNVHGSDTGAPPATRATVTFSLSAAASIRIWVYNFTPANESGVLSVLLTR
jgi:hypothetical protein